MKARLLSIAAIMIVSGHALPTTVLAQDEDEYKFEYTPAPRKPWQEQAATLPPFPANQDLLAIEMTGPTNVTANLDRSTLQVGDDGVVRAVYVITSSGGVRNTFFDGFRCATRQYKTYAYSVGTAEWTRATNTAWKDIQRRSINAVRDTLHEDYFCTGLTQPRTKREILQRFLDRQEEP